jgi:hypothetical protein
MGDITTSWIKFSVAIVFLRAPDTSLHQNRGHQRRAPDGALGYLRSNGDLSRRRRWVSPWHARDKIYYFEVPAVLLRTLTKKNPIEVVFFSREGTTSIYA